MTVNLSFDTRNISPPLDQFALFDFTWYVGRSSSTFFEHGCNLSDIASGKFLRCVEIDLKEEQWQSIAESIRDEN